MAKRSERCIILKKKTNKKKKSRRRRRANGGNKSCCPIENFLGATLKTAASKTIAWQNYPGGRALVTHIMSPALTGKFMAEKNGEWERLRSSFFSIQISFFLLAVVRNGI